ncbi:hypothetical protein N7516_002567 [Penicillium verrucosum]|uniref:uncharacterized protein n=1 Tax=Penicillium verrucosum TaxID=60171 RepID=UPI0025453E24|nr:uncharacterized protein N7516_002567 [Penicillium verrucosum]KAJ5942399.1 hypothetical protein N7516_002567 [Penicillium verrucosum]
MTDKFTKQNGFVPGKATWQGIDWSKSVLTFWWTADWGAIISDRDPKFTKGLWHGVFKLLQVDIFFTTADHPQADGQSERTNQTLEIAIRHWTAQQRRTETEHAHIDQPVPATSRWDEALYLFFRPY